MSKDQINYLLVLLTVFILWLFFNTFYMGARMGPRPAVLGGGRGPVFSSPIPRAPKIPAPLNAPQVSGMRPSSVQAPSVPEMVAEVKKALEEKK